MPELPEVETIRRALAYGGREGLPILGRQVLKTHLLWERTLAEPSPAEFQARLAGQRIQDVGRRGKFLLPHLSQGALLIHPRVSGDLLVETQDAPPASHHRLMLDLE